MNDEQIEQFKAQVPPPRRWAVQERLTRLPRRSSSWRRMTAVTSTASNCLSTGGMAQI